MGALFMDYDSEVYAPAVVTGDSSGPDYSELIWMLSYLFAIEIGIFDDQPRERGESDDSRVRL